MPTAVCYPRGLGVGVFSQGIYLPGVWGHVPVPMTGDKNQGWVTTKATATFQREVSTPPPVLHPRHTRKSIQFLGCNLTRTLVSGHLCLDLSAEHKWPFCTLFCTMHTSTKTGLDAVHKQTRPFADKAGEACVGAVCWGLAFPR